MRDELAVPTEQREAMAMLRIAGYTLVLPQREIWALESLTEIDRASPGPGSVGWMTHAGQRWPVYCLTEHFGLCEAMRDGCRTVILLAGGANSVALLCEEASIARQALPRVHELPLAMRFPDTPVEGLVELEHGVGCATNAERLGAYVTKLAGW